MLDYIVMQMTKVNREKGYFGYVYEFLDRSAGVYWRASAAHYHVKAPFWIS